jgi:SNF2 family DNA or RNA helicase
LLEIQPVFAGARTLEAQFADLTLALSNVYDVSDTTNNFPPEFDWHFQTSSQSRDFLAKSSLPLVDVIHTPFDVDDSRLEPVETMRAVNWTLASETISTESVSSTWELSKAVIQTIPLSFQETDIHTEPAHFPQTSTIDTICTTDLNCIISPDLHEPLMKTKAAGKDYSVRLGSLTGASIERKDREGFRKSYSEKRSRNSTTRDLMTIWDVIRPLLEPPLTLETSEIVLLPGDLYSYQIAGVKFLLEGTSALLGDDMGTGKTVQTAVAMRMLFQRGDITKALIVVPLALLRNWDRELEKWVDNISRVTVVRGNQTQRATDWERQAHVYIATYGTISSDIEIIRKHHKQFDLVVLDEIQNIKNQNAKRTAAIKRLPRKRAWGLSGTPIENALSDLESIFGFLAPDLAPSNFFSPYAAKKVMVPPYFLRRRKQDVLKDLPEKVVAERWLDLTDSQRTSYDRAFQEGIVHLRALGEEVSVQHVFALLTKLKEICNFDPQTGDSCKLACLVEDLEQAVDGGSKALVFSQYLEMGIEQIAAALKKYNPAIISGKVSGTGRDREADRFRQDNACKVLIATQRAGGVGLNLQEANYVFHFDHWWNPAIGRQAEDRAHRLGQKKTVFVYYFWIADTLEERIYQILEKKKALYGEVIDEQSTVEGTRLTTEDLFGLFGLKPPTSKKAETARKRFEDLTSLQFEELIERLYKAMGYATRVTAQSRDGGIDVVASKNTAGSGNMRLGIQCKLTKVGHRFDRPEVDRLLGVLSSDSSFTKGIFVTNGTFTEGARAMEAKHGSLELIDGPLLDKYLRQMNIQL